MGNMLINDVDVCIKSDPVKKTEQLTFVMDDINCPIQMKMCDLGLAELYKNNDDGICTFTSSKYAGKHNYKSPEIIAKNKAFSAKSNDIWCLGVTLFMMIIGGSPWNSAKTDDEHFELIMNGKIMDVINKWD